MQIRLIVDISANSETRGIVDDLARRFDNISVYYADSDDMDSVWRACVEDIDASNERFVAVLDAESEAVSDGYAKLYDRIMRNDMARSDLVFGNYLIRSIEQLDEVKCSCSDSGATDDDTYLGGSLQSAVMRKEVFMEASMLDAVHILKDGGKSFRKFAGYAHHPIHMDFPIHVRYTTEQSGLEKEQSIIEIKSSGE
jgi:hypothetical protein